MKKDSDTLGQFKEGEIPELVNKRKQRKKSDIRVQIEKLLETEKSSYIVYSNIEQSQINKIRGLVSILNMQQKENKQNKRFKFKNGIDDKGSQTSIVFIKDKK